jgi:hypothetical protein
MLVTGIVAGGQLPSVGKQLARHALLESIRIASLEKLHFIGIQENQRFSAHLLTRAR